MLSVSLNKTFPSFKFFVFQTFSCRLFRVGKMHSCFSFLVQGRERERNVLFNDALNTFYLWLYGVRHMVKDHSDSEKGNPLPPHRLLLSISSKGSFICTIPHYTSRGALAGTRNSSMGPLHEGSIRQPIAL